MEDITAFLSFARLAYHPPHLTKLLGQPIGECTMLSGGAVGSDAYFAIHAKAAGDDVVHISFEGHSYTPETVGKRFIVPHNLLKDAYRAVIETRNDHKGRKPTISRNSYVKWLLCRNMIIAQYATSLYAVVVDFGVPPSLDNVGGTAWACRRFLKLNSGGAVGAMSIYVFCENAGRWYQCNSDGDRYTTWHLRYTPPPRPTGTYAAIGARDIGARGKKAIRDLFDEKPKTLEHEDAW